MPSWRCCVVPATLAVAALLCGTSASIVSSQVASTLVLDKPWSRATPSGAKVAGGFVTVRNTGPAADRLVGGSTEIAGRVEVHESTTVEGVARMRELDQGLVIGAGATIELKPGGHHLMFQDLKRPLREGDRFTARLRFERAGETQVEFWVAGVGATGSAGAHSGHRGH